MAKGWHNDAYRHALASRGVKTVQPNMRLRSRQISDIDPSYDFEGEEIGQDFVDNEFDSADEIALNDLSFDAGEIKRQEVFNYDAEQELDMKMSDDLANTEKAIDDARDSMTSIKKQRLEEQITLSQRLKEIDHDESKSRGDKRSEKKRLKREFNEKYDELMDQSRRDLDRSSMNLGELEEQKDIENMRDSIEHEYHATRLSAMEKQGKIENIEQQIEEFRVVMQLRRMKSIDPKDLKIEEIKRMNELTRLKNQKKLSSKRLKRDIVALQTEIATLRADQKEVLLDIKAKASSLKMTELRERADLMLDKLDRKTLNRVSIKTANRLDRQQKGQTQASVMSAKAGILLQKSAAAKEQAAARQKAETGLRIQQAQQAGVGASSGGTGLLSAIVSAGSAAADRRQAKKDKKAEQKEVERQEDFAAKEKADQKETDEIAAAEAEVDRLDKRGETEADAKIKENREARIKLLDSDLLEVKTIFELDAALEKAVQKATSEQELQGIKERGQNRRETLKKQSAIGVEQERAKDSGDEFFKGDRIPLATEAETEAKPKIRATRSPGDIEGGIKPTPFKQAEIDATERKIPLRQGKGKKQKGLKQLEKEIAAHDSGKVAGISRPTRVARSRRR